MGKKAKVGKARKDKFYHLAKETGYRSRAAFKLIQLNRKYEFLQRSNVIIDLCAAPGGWLQVASENAPMSNHIIGIDLVPITSIHNVKTLQEDITTESCRQALRKELHTAKADCFLNDGAPNIGKNWLHDAFLQAELTLHALKLATEFLRKGGWFVTKLFRSKDYDALLWVFQQMFKQVHATKPQASRNESAEIFVVCQGYLAPDKIDPKFLDPRHVFQEVDKTQKAAIDLIHPEKRRRQREGYAEGDYTLFHSLPATEYLESEDFMDLLAQSSEIRMDTDVIRLHPLTTPEVLECAKDIKVLGKKEIKSLFAWRKKLKAELDQMKASVQTETGDGSDEESGEEEDPVEEESKEGDKDDAEMEELETMLEQKNQEELKTMKKAKKKVQKAQAKQKARIDLKMTIPGDRPDFQDDENIFDITKIRSRKELATVEEGDLSYMDGEDMFEASEDEGPTVKPRRYFDRDDKKYVGVGEDSDSDEEEEMEEEPDFEEEGEEEDDEAELTSSELTSTNPLVVDMGEKTRLRQDKQEAWFQKESFAGLEEDTLENMELDLTGPRTKAQKASKKTKKSADTSDEASSTQSGKRVKKEKLSETLGSTENRTKGSKGVKKKEEEKVEEVDTDEEMNNIADEDLSDSSDDGGSESDDSVYNMTDMLSANRKKKTRSAMPLRKPVTADGEGGGLEVVPQAPLALDEEGLAIGAAMVQSRKRRREIMESGFHRYMFNDDNLPDWFSHDEKRHMKRIRPVSKEEIDEYKLKTKAIDAQPIKKIAEAKARKKRKVMKRTEKARKKANAITDAIDTSEKEKWSQIKQIYKKAGLLNKAKPSVTYVVAKKGAGKKVRRPAGVKGQFKVVDKRMKKDMRAEKAKLKKSGPKGKGKGRGGPSPRKGGR